MQKFHVFGKVSDDQAVDVIVNGWRELQSLLSGIRNDGSYTETKITVEVVS